MYIVVIKMQDTQTAITGREMVIGGDIASNNVQ